MINESILPKITEVMEKEQRFTIERLNSFLGITELKVDELIKNEMEKKLFPENWSFLMKIQRMSILFPSQIPQRGARKNPVWRPP